MLLTATALLLCQQSPTFVVDNRAAEAREETIRVSLPFPRGRYRQLAGGMVGGRFAAAVPLVRWGDGSLAVVQLHARVSLPPVSRRSFVVSPLIDLPAKPVAAPPAAGEVPADLPVQLELEDPWGTVFRTGLKAVDSVVIQETPLVRVRRYRTAFSNGERRFFDLTAYLTTFRGERRAELTLVVENGLRPGNPVIGPARFRSVSLVVTDPSLRTRPRFIGENRLVPPTRDGQRWRQVLLQASDQWYLGDHTGKAWRFDLFQDDPELPTAVRGAAALATDVPLVALPELAWTRFTGAFGAHGGPAPGPGRPTPTAAFLIDRWNKCRGFGPFGGFGEPRDGTAGGTPRNGPSALHNLLRFGSGGLLHAAEGMVLQASLRPTSGMAVRLPAVTAPLRQGLSKRVMQRPHGWLAMDYEHYSVDLLYDYYWLTGDMLARDEMVRAGRGLRAVLADLPFLTCRGEGWCMQSAVLIAKATGDGALVEFVDRRFDATVVPALAPPDAGHVLRQPPHPDALGGKAYFDCPWQMGAFIHGAAALAMWTGDPAYRDAGLRAARVMAGPGWVEGRGPKYLVSAADPGRYTMPVGFGALEGTALMQLGGFVLAEAMAVEEQDKRLFRERAGQLFAPYEKVSRQRTAMNPWFQLMLDRDARSAAGGAIEGVKKR